MKKISLFLTFFIALSSFKTTSARPISYAGGTTLMVQNDAIENSLHIHYSPSYKYSVGLKSEYFHRDEIALNSLQLNHLGKRWNLPDAQGNVYLKFNAGNAHHSGQDEAYGAAGLAADFEDRRFFVSYENFYAKSQDDIISMFSQKARIGVAPYVANYGNIHTWLMLQVQHQPKYDGDMQIITTPLVRLFKGLHLVEFGVSSNKRILFNFIARF